MSAFFEQRPVPRWWLVEPGKNPIGPIDGELLAEWVEAGLVHADAMVCEVGEQRWQAIDGPARLRSARSRFDPSKERCLLDMEPLPHESAPRHDVPARGAATPDTVPPISGERSVAGAAAEPVSEVDAFDDITRVDVPRPLRAATGTERK